MDKKTIIRYLVSSLVTFLSSFLSAFALGLTDNITKDALVALCVVGLRAGVKALAEYLPSLLKK